ncbi:aromatic ring-hydroxylating dioxygenase subunit alpha [Streptomyces sp. SAJ15]|uniref:aromatic ring-hydroxylating oxygenase subunit alpha n=1 Tax=Streptomyces sp. SAJ15 TaxID=2011095 RepID=UPI001186B9F8|nr:Rieske 2Fe-2S domain-containing protein [Streptomyces sp. SAJ15]TVL89147.1 (2Fe-2S)-binding protein [Streptomyces sp. SAJ15]
MRLWGLDRSERRLVDPGLPQAARLPYPDGWFALATSAELKPGTVLNRRLTGEDVVLYRTASGRPRAVRPYCPHLGAHLGHGATVRGENIRCPFHHFRFGPDGVCVATGYGTPPPKARLATLPCRELDGLVFVWRHARHEPPSWEIEALPPEGFPEPYCVLLTRRDHPQDVMENLVDYGHFLPVHGYRLEVVSPPRFEGTRLETANRIRTGRAGAAWKISAASPVSRVVMQGLGVVRVQVDSPQFRFRARGWFCVTPTDPCRVEIRMAVALRPAGTGHGRLVRTLVALAARPYTWLAARDNAEDVPIWENKTHLAHPRLTKGDGPIGRFRRWAEQFYSEPLGSGAERLDEGPPAGRGRGG